MNLYSNDTLKILNLLKKYNINTNDHTNITSNKFFMKLYDDFNKIINSISINNLKIENYNNSEIDNLKNNKFTSENILNNIIDTIKYYYIITFENNSIIYYSTKSIKNNKIPKIIIHMFIIIKALKILFNRNNYHQKVVYFETYNKKLFPLNNSILSPNEVNSGLTNLDFHKNGTIILFRKEELLKVLIHELIHSNLIDEKIIFSNKIKGFSNGFCVKYNILLNEAFTETIALILNIFYINIIGNNNKLNLDIMFNNELKYSDYICSKIMDYYNIKNIEDIIKKNEVCNKDFPQKTNVFSYYVLKNILLYQHIKFANIIKKYSIDYKINNELSIIKIIELLNKNINKLNSRLINVSSDKNKSLRLCLYELKI